MTGSASAFEKRLKRRVIARSHEWFAATAPGLETICRAELATLLPDSDPPVVETGGVRFRARLYDGYRVNLCLRTANRVLMRIDSFRATQFPQLQKRLADIPWELYLPPGELPAPRVTAHKSRLYHSKAVAERVTDAIADRWQAFLGHDNLSAPEPSPQHVFVRADHDRFTISLDSSGDLLYKRGIKTHGGIAPIRETLASAVLMMAGYDGRGPLIDPMCGSGTFTLEAAMMAAAVPSGWFRRFAFMRWPAFRPSQWAHIRQQADALKKADIPHIFASDRSQQACADLWKSCCAHRLDSHVTVTAADFFSQSAGKILEQAGLKDRFQSGLVVINPPYGRRLAPAGKGQGMTREILKKLTADFRGWRFALLAPLKGLPHTLPSGTARFPLRHGGLKLDLLIGRAA